MFIVVGKLFLSLFSVCFFNFLLSSSLIFLPLWAWRIRIQGRGNFLLIIEDVRFREDKAVFKDILQGVDPAALKAVCRAFVRQHVAYWREPPISTVWSFSPETGLPSNRNTPPVVRLLIEGGFYSVMKKYKTKLRLTPEVEETLHLALANYSQLRSYWSTAPLTLCHGDSHMGLVRNPFFLSLC
jgi:hypothetical protein